MLFIDVVAVFDYIQQIQSRLAITQALANLFKQLTPEELSIICNLCLGQLHPVYIGTQFNIASKIMTKVVANLCQVTDTVINEKVKEIGDIGDVLALYQWEVQDELIISEVYQALVHIEKISGIGSQEEKAIQVKHLLTSSTPQEAKYVVRMILGKLRLGFSDMTIIDALSWMITGDKSLHVIIEDAYNVCADIGLIAKTLKSDGIEALKAMKIHVGIPIRPAAAERLPNAHAVIEKIGPCAAEPKLDGFRLQIHIQIDEKDTRHTQFYSRNLHDMSAMFPDLLKAFETMQVQTIVCEGEAISFDPHTGNFLPFQETVKRKRKHDIEEVMTEFPLKIFLFDLLYYNGQSYLTLPWRERRAKLVELVAQTHNEIIQHTQVQITDTDTALDHYFWETIEAGLEGLVVKKMDAPYQPGKRNFNWIKLKRHQEGTLEDTLDCVILGYYKGLGKRSLFGIGALLVGVYNKEKDIFQTIARIGTGLSDEGWREIKKRCDPIALPEPPHNVEYHKNVIPDVWVEPSIVCQIFADEVTRSPVHTAGKTETELGYALRFPRFIDYRSDKTAYEATTTSEIRRMYEDQFI
ncbi:MAG TPA: ATP-dependent DNA ligase [Candidatus Babeliales bacterium]|jgi:DNA ligase-1|nr:ATP-dependent DNA ligase [Candidatus Babeliales bacterium]